MELIYQSMEKEQVDPIPTTTTGIIPRWIHGSFYRIGPGNFEFGDDLFDHLFDGSSIIHRFFIKDGQVTYQNKFLRTEVYKKNLAANRIVVSEFGTFAHPDPCKNVFQRFTSCFKPREPSDNNNVSIFPIGDTLFAASDGPFIHEFHPQTLDTGDRIEYKKAIGVVMSTAHPHIDNDGIVHNYGSIIDKGYNMAMFKLTPSTKGENGVPFSAEIVAKFKPQSQLHPSYLHSFGMTENYYVIIEGPCRVNTMKVVTISLTRNVVIDALEWNKKFKNIFHIIDKKTGKPVNEGLTYVSRDQFIMLHHVNAYEENGYIVVDGCCYENGDVLKANRLDDLRTRTQITGDRDSTANYRRFVLPLNPKPEGKNDSKLLNMPGCDATAVLKGNKVICHYETIAKGGCIDFPQVNYKRFNGKKHRYVYCTRNSQKLIKIDVHTKEIKTWEQKDAFASEPFFVEAPDAAEEDDGVVLTIVLFPGQSERKKTCLLVLDAKTFLEIGRAFVDILLPYSLHSHFGNSI